VKLVITIDKYTIYLMLAFLLCALMGMIFGRV